MPDVHRCRPADREAALDTVLAAFATDPLLRWVWPSDARYDACAPPFFGLLLDLRIESGEVWVATDSDTGEVASVSMWEPPGGLYLRTGKERETAVQDLFTAGERAAWTTYDRSTSAPSAAGPHWYLGVLATRPERQGRGLGRAVTAPMLAAADRAGLPAYLETSSTTNVAVYERLGFAVERDVAMPDGGPHCWVMRREPCDRRTKDEEQT